MLLQLQVLYFNQGQIKLQKLFKCGEVDVTNYLS